MTLRVKIYEFSQTGLLALQFSENLLQISNLTNVNSTVLDMRIVDGEEGEDVEYGYTWEVTEMLEDFVYI